MKKETYNNGLKIYEKRPFPKMLQQPLIYK